MSVLKRNYLLGTLALTFQIRIHGYCSQHCFHSILTFHSFGTPFLVSREVNLNNFSFVLLLSYFENWLCAYGLDFQSVISLIKFVH